MLTCMWCEITLTSTGIALILPPLSFSDCWIRLSTARLMSAHARSAARRPSSRDATTADGVRAVGEPRERREALGAGCTGEEGRGCGGREAWQGGRGGTGGQGEGGGAPRCNRLPKSLNIVEPPERTMFL